MLRHAKIALCKMINFRSTRQWRAQRVAVYYITGWIIDSISPKVIALLERTCHHDGEQPRKLSLFIAVDDVDSFNKRVERSVNGKREKKKNIRFSHSQKWINVLYVFIYCQSHAKSTELDSDEIYISISSRENITRFIVTVRNLRSVIRRAPWNIVNTFARVARKYRTLSSYPDIRASSNSWCNDPFVNAERSWKLWGQHCSSLGISSSSSSSSVNTVVFNFCFRVYQSHDRNGRVGYNVVWFQPCESMRTFCHIADSTTSQIPLTPSIMIKLEDLAIFPTLNEKKFSMRETDSPSYVYA